MITYRTATRAELDIAVEWAAAEGWNPGLHDAALFWHTDPAGFVCAERDGGVIATGSIVAYGDAAGFMGFFIVRPDLRGQGIGREFWTWRRDTLRARLRPDAPIAMDGVFDMQAFYARGGFQFTHRNLRMAGTGRRSAQLDPALVDLSVLPFADVLAYDTAHFGCSRARFLEPWIRPAGGLALGFVTHHTLRGIGVIRPCREGYKIGPLFADDAHIAEALFVGLSAHAADQPLFLDTPENNPAALALAQAHGLTEVFGCARMVHGPIPDLPWNRIYGVTTFELG
ncbi:GNAT family N-acetyltransferase [Actomonas aquatica]|uniref:GNAT family N-acetyltransferase n=1 Tax=Actomonas aquatica TaxID=2866162 RepID=A0ABZ1CB92_9BACT|nr:GNAT family N-acetyltransferase [Opitutus sp. WL0086]WRQ88915.1 GNAT family N-acetyltransferase [Opitutus sp. WL0086]